MAEEVLDCGLGVVLLDLVVDLVVEREAVNVESLAVLCLVVAHHGRGVSEGEDGVAAPAGSLQVAPFLPALLPHQDPENISVISVM